jgi:predicted PurR-regulated permease PerM
MTPQKGQLYFLGVLGLIAVVANIAIFLPFLIVIVVSAMCAVILSPLYVRIEKLFRGKKSLASLTVLLIVGVVIIAPLVFIAHQVFADAVGLYGTIKAGGVDGLVAIVHKVELPIQEFFPNFSIDVQKYAALAVSFIADNLGRLFSSTAYGVFNIFLGILMLFYFLKDGAKFRKEIVRLSPLADNYDREILSCLSLAVNSVVKGSLLVACIQGIFTGVGLAFFGVPNATLWATIAAVAALVPGLGTAFVILPSVIFLFVTGNTGSSLGLLAWGVLAVGLIDNMLLPMFLKKDFHIHPLLILLSVLGGISFFGILGFLLGPLLLSLLFTLGDIYKMMVSGTVPKRE